MKILIACEFSGTVRDAFIARGHDAVSCDLLETDKPGPHIKGDVMDVLDGDWDGLIAHPPCTFLTVSGNKWMKPEFQHRFPSRAEDREQAVEFFMALYESKIPKVAIENPIGIMSTRFRKPDQVIQPWMFGHGEKKATCLWLKNFPPLIPTHIDNDLFAVDTPVEREQKMYKLPPSPDRWKLRSVTYQGIAGAMADQWGVAA